MEGHGLRLLLARVVAPSGQLVSLHALEDGRILGLLGLCPNDVNDRRERVNMRTQGSHLLVWRVEDTAHRSGHGCTNSHDRGPDILQDAVALLESALDDLEVLDKCILL